MNINYFDCILTINLQSTTGQHLNMSNTVIRLSPDILISNCWHSADGLGCITLKGVYLHEGSEHAAIAN